MKNKILFTALVLICLISLISTAQAGKETKIVPDQRLVVSTATYGNLVTWYETSTNSPHIYDRSTGKELNISSYEAVSSNMQIYENKVVWQGMDDGVSLCDASTKEVTKISDEAYIPDIYGNNIVYEKIEWLQTEPYSLSSLYLYDLTTKKETQITDYIHTDYKTAIYGTKIIWVRSDEPSTIYIYDIPSKQSSITSASGVVSSLDIYGNTIIWQSGSNEKNDIYMRDISAHKTTQITTGGSAIEPAIYGDRIVYLSANNVHMYDKSTGETISITNCGCAYAPSIYDDKIVYADSHEAGEMNWELGSIYLYDLAAQSEKPTANFTANVTSGAAPLNVQFTSETTGNPTDYYWVFEPSTSSDWNSHHPVNAVHTFTQPGVYAVALTVSNDAGNYTVSKEGYITVTGAGGSTGNIPKADFSANVTSGPAPLAVLFTDTSTGFAPASWLWNFGDGTSSENAMNATHTFTEPGNYEISLIMKSATGNATVIKANYIIVTDPDAPVAGFSSNTTKGSAPLTVQFSDSSLNAVSRSWDFDNNGQVDSNEINPVYVYEAPGTYTVNLTVSNEKGISSTTAEIAVIKKSSSSGGSSGSGGGGGGSPEPAKNVEVKELTQAFITGDKNVKFNFTKNATCVVYVSFDAKKTLGKTTTIAEMLKGKSALVSELPSGDVYKSFNVWVGNGGVASSKNIENPVVCFKVEKAWLQNKSVDPASITLNRYIDKKWEQLPVNVSGENEEYIYFTAETPEFSSFAITGTSKKSSETESQFQTGSETGTLNQDNTGVSKPEAELKSGQEAEQEAENQDSRSLPGFEVYYTVIGLIAMFLYKRK